MSGQRIRLALRLAYDGKDLAGWQRQPGKRTVQALVHKALVDAGLPGKPHAASRTDAGVHAAAQIAHVDAPIALASDLDRMRVRINAALANDIRLTHVVVAPRRFHARWSSRGKIYTYLLSAPENLNAANEDSFLAERTWIIPDPRAFPALADQPTNPDEDAMRRALSSLLGRRDFAGLSTARDAHQGSQVRRLGAGRIVSTSYSGPAGGRLLCVTVAGDAFLKHMVRNLVGLLTQVGFGEVDPADVSNLVASRRRHHGPRAPGRGLTLIKVRYPLAVRPNFGSLLSR